MHAHPDITPSHHVRSSFPFSSAQAMREYPSTNCVLVRRHGAYVWGENWQKAKSMAECYDYLFELAVMMKKMGIDPEAVPEDSKYINEKRLTDK